MDQRCHFNPIVYASIWSDYRGPEAPPPGLPSLWCNASTSLGTTPIMQVLKYHHLLPPLLQPRKSRLTRLTHPASEENMNLRRLYGSNAQHVRSRDAAPS